MNTHNLPYSLFHVTGALDKKGQMHKTIALENDTIAAFLSFFSSLIPSLIDLTPRRKKKHKKDVRAGSNEGHIVL